MRISRQLLIQAMLNCIVLATVIALSAWRLDALRTAITLYQRDHGLMYQLSEIKAAALEISRADLLSPDTTKNLQKTDELIKDRWQKIASVLSADEAAKASPIVNGNWENYKKNFNNALAIFATSPQDALSIPDQIYTLHIVPINAELDRLATLKRDSAIANEAAIGHQLASILWTILVPLATYGAFVLAMQQRFGSRLRKRLDEFVAATQELGRGNLRVRLPEKQRDEIAQLAAAVNAFVDAFDGMLRAVVSTADEVRTVSTAIHEQSIEVIGKTEHQSSRVNEINQSIAEMVSAMELIASSSEEAAGHSHSAHGASMEATALGSRTSRNISELAHVIDEASVQLGGLSNSVGQISEVSSLIKGIAQQTNLLALNAAIEAARAGEHGRGFSVVADEVRTLAEQTASSTVRIEGLVQTISHAAAEVVDAMRIVASEAEESKAQGDEIAKALAHISKAATDVNRMLEGIASATDQQNATTNSIGSHIQGIAHIAKDTHHSMEVTSQHITTLRDLANRLGEATNRFVLA